MDVAEEVAVGILYVPGSAKLRLLGSRGSGSYLEDGGKTLVPERDEFQDKGSSEESNPGPVYEPPAITWEEALDARPNLALACGKTSGPFCASTGGFSS
jgi:hypothetical protein